MECILTDSVLVLNKYYQPINVISVKKALKKIIKHTAEVVSVEEERYCSYTFSSWAELSEVKKELEMLGQFDDFILDTQNLKFVVPRVIRAINYDKLPIRSVKRNRRNIFARDNNICQYCGKHFSTSKLNIEHVIPQSKGGKNTWTNLVCSCIECNSRKANRTPEEAGMKLIRKPFEPKISPAFKVTIQHKKYMTWKYFLSEIYWDAELEE